MELLGSVVLVLALILIHLTRKWFYALRLFLLLSALYSGLVYLDAMEILARFTTDAFSVASDASVLRRLAVWVEILGSILLGISPPTPFPQDPLGVGFQRLIRSLNRFLPHRGYNPGCWPSLPLFVCRLQDTPLWMHWDDVPVVSRGFRSLNIRPPHAGDLAGVEQVPACVPVATSHELAPYIHIFKDKKRA